MLIEDHDYIPTPDISVVEYSDITGLYISSFTFSNNNEISPFGSEGIPYFYPISKMV